MSWSDQDIDKLFQQAKQPEIPPFQESFWTEMEALLPEQKRKKVAVWWWAGGTAVVAVLLTIGLTVSLNGTDAPQQTASAQSAVKDQTAIKASSTETTATTSEITAETPIESVVNQQAITPSHQTFSFTSGAKCGGPNKIVKQQIASDNRNAGSNEIKSSAANEYAMENLPPIDLNFRNPGIQVRTPKALTYKPTRFYVQASAGLGLSSRKNVPQGADYLHCYSIGGGLYKKLDNVVLTFGIQGRVDFVRNIRYTYYPDGTPTKRIDADYRQLYSVELPASIGVMNGRNSFAFTVNAGFQAGVFGELKETNNEVVVRSENMFVHVDKKATTLTMELGCSYLRTITPDWYLGAGVNADIIEPFNGASYAGKQRLLPVNGQILLRRTF